MERGDVRLLIEAQDRLNQGEGRLPVTNLTRPLRHYDVTALRVGGGRNQMWQAINTQLRQLDHTAPTGQH